MKPQFGIRFVRMGTRNNFHRYATELFCTKDNLLIDRCPDWDHYEDIVTKLINYARDNIHDLAYKYAIADDLSFIEIYFDAVELMEFQGPETTKELDFVFMQIQHFMSCLLCDVAKAKQTERQLEYGML